MSERNFYDKVERVVNYFVLTLVVITVIILITESFPRLSLPPGAVFQTNPAKEWRVVMSDGAVTPVRTKDRAAELAWDYWEVNQCPTNTLYWRTVR